MSQREHPNMRAMWMALSDIGATLFRLNSGKAWLGGKAARLPDNSVLVPSARPIALGLTMANGDPVPGQSDLGGFTEVVITQDMVGCKVAVFTAIEAKREKGGKATDVQLSFVDLVRRAGGIAGIANTVAVAQDIVRNWSPPRA